MHTPKVAVCHTGSPGDRESIAGGTVIKPYGS